MKGGVDADLRGEEGPDLKGQTETIRWVQEQQEK
jgi:hypothetical protein